MSDANAAVIAADGSSRVGNEDADTAADEGGDGDNDDVDDEQSGGCDGGDGISDSDGGGGGGDDIEADKCKGGGGGADKAGSGAPPPLRPSSHPSFISPALSALPSSLSFPA